MNAESTIDVDMTTLSSTGRSRTVSTAVSIDDEDLCNMAMFTFNGMDEEAVVYTKTRATTRIFEDYSEQVAWHGVMMEPGRVGFATLIRSPTGDVVGNFNTESRTYTLIKMSDGTTSKKRSGKMRWEAVHPTTMSMRAHQPEAEVERILESPRRCLLRSTRAERRLRLQAKALRSRGIHIVYFCVTIETAVYRIMQWSMS